MNRYIPLVIIAIIAVVIGVAVAIAGRSEQISQTTTGPQPSMQRENQTNPSAATNNSVKADVVEIKDFAYQPSDITVKKGTTVTWTNRDNTAHTVTADNGNGPDSELLSKGQSYSYTFNEAGVFSYFCKPHPSMRGKVTVID